MHTSFILQVSNKPGLIIRVALVFERRGYSIQTLNVQPMDNAIFAEMLITASGDSSKKEQIIKQLYKLIDVIKVEEAVELEELIGMEEKCFIV